MITETQNIPLTGNVKPIANMRQWLASLSLVFSHSNFGTALAATKRQGPLSVQKAFYPEGRDCAHIYLLHPPAGIVSGDQLRISLELQKNAHVLVTTPGANRFYRAREDQSIGESKQLQITTFSLAQHAICENFPQETIVYEGADAVNTVDIHLSSSSVYFGWDISCLGLPSSNQPFKHGSYTQLNRLYCDNKLIYHDRIAISPNNQLMAHSAGLAGRSVFATFLVYAPKQLALASERQQLVEHLREIIEQQHAENKVSITDIKGLLVIRYLGEQANEAKHLFIRLWQHLRPQLISNSAVEPRVWHT
ncbi:urease accessory protein UreD [Thalassotalea sp. PLHSN55]|uniref:urease accessory protein UreD n=1 Tax=Thalassotalea sp. PLHSN55 TaxID=3435888 RepID=UPI003F86E247